MITAIGFVIGAFFLGYSLVHFQSAKKFQENARKWKEMTIKLDEVQKKAETLLVSHPIP